mgnify:CR=1 FL=1
MKTKEERIREMIENEINIEKLVSEIDKIMQTSERSPKNKETVAEMLQQIDQIQAEEYEAIEEYEAELHFKEIESILNL